MLKPLNLIINAIKNKGKDLEGMYVAIDKYGNIIDFDNNLENVRDSVGKYNWEIASRDRPVYYLNRLTIRNRIKKLL